MTLFKKLLWVFPLLLMACIKVPEGVTVVEDFELERYLGTWHEIARIDNSFEKGMVAVQATYTLDEEGKVRVLNRGYDQSEGTWRGAKGMVKFVDTPDRGELKVSFFGPFYSSYNIIALDREEYSWALVCGYKPSLFWILSKQEVMDEELYTELVAKAAGMGFDTSALIRNLPASSLPPP